MSKEKDRRIVPNHGNVEMLGISVTADISPMAVAPPIGTSVAPSLIISVIIGR